MSGPNQTQSTTVSAIPEYTTPYNAIIRDNVVMGVTRYFLERWVPLLGTAPATVVNTLRQLDYQCQDDVVTISGEALAHEAALSRRHLYTCLDTAWMGAFVRLESGRPVRTKTGEIVQQPNRYHVRMDDPLVPADAEHLVDLLPRLADTPLAATHQAQEMEPRTLWATSPAEIGPRFTVPRAITMRDVLHRAFPTWQPANPSASEAFAQAAEALHRHITLVRPNGRASKIIVPQYFRRKWWGLLGHDLAWSYLWLRGWVYDNPADGIERDTCWISSLNALLTIIGRSREWWRRHVEHAKAHPAGWAVTDFFTQLDAQKGRDPAHPQRVARQFAVALDIPIAPEDRARYKELLSTWQATPIAASRDATGSATSEHTGSAEGSPQMSTLASGGSATDEHTGDQEVCHTPAQGSATNAHSKSESKEKALPEKNQDRGNSKQPPLDSVTSAVAAEKIKSSSEQELSLSDCLLERLKHAPDTPLFRAASVELFLRHAWPDPVRPLTPAWTLAVSGQIPPAELIALMLAIWADRSIKSPSRYLSWLTRRWLLSPGITPVEHWGKWRALAKLSLRDWMYDGQRQWTVMATRHQQTLPLGLNVLFEEYFYGGLGTDLAPEPGEGRGEAVWLSTTHGLKANGLDEYPGGGPLTVRDIWSGALDQLRAQLNQAAFAAWLEDTSLVSYENGILTVGLQSAPPHEKPGRSLRISIEVALSKLADFPIKVRYVVGKPGEEGDLSSGEEA